VIVEVAAPGRDVVTVIGFRAEIIERVALTSSGVAITPRRMPEQILSSDLEEPHQRAVSSFQELEVPQFELLLDSEPAVVRAALGADGRPARPTPTLPTTLHPGEYAKFTMAPVTDDMRLVRWLLHLDWAFYGSPNTHSYRLLITGDTGFRTFVPGGSSPSVTPVRNVADDHWEVNVPGTQPTKGRDSWTVAVHGSSDGFWEKLPEP
jgi:hypothetical protein